jgi:PEP-CTERM motif-containing protein
MLRSLMFLGAAMFAFGLLTGTAKADPLSIINSNFNGTAIDGGNTVWFSSHMKVNGVGTQPVTLSVTNSVITFSSGGQVYSLVTPNAQITFSPTAQTASTTFDSSTNTWMTTVPSSQAGADPFMTGLAFLVPTGGLPGGINPVSWQATFSSDSPNISGSWQWGAAVYTNFSTDYNDLGVLAADGGGQSGTPLNFESSVVGGARGGGGSNFTGSNSATGHFDAGTSEVPEPSSMILLGSGLTAAASFIRRRRRGAQKI